MKKLFDYHPYLFALYPFLFFFAHNKNQLILSDFFITGTVVFFICTFLTTFIVLSILKFIFKDTPFAALITSLFVFMFFSYGHIHDIIAGLIVKYPSIRFELSAGFFVGPNKYAYIIFLGMIGLGLMILFRLRKKAEQITKIAGVFILFLVISSGLKILIYPFYTGNYKTNQSSSISDDELQELKEDPAIGLPDIYHFIVDSYPSKDTLKRYYGYDNTPFHDWLKSKGFYIAEKSYSNYAYSVVSIPSMLNMVHLEGLKGFPDKESVDETIPFQMIKENKVAKYFQSLGYKYVHVSSTYPGTATSSIADHIYEGNQWSNQTTIKLIGNTPLKPLYDSNFNRDERGRILYAFEQVPKIEDEIKGPKFVFVHFLSPHSPFVFGPNGEERSYPPGFIELSDTSDINNAVEPFLDQVKHMNMRMKSIIEKLLSNPEKQPIILMHADHGPGMIKGWDAPYEGDYMINHMRIFSSYYLPKGGDKHLYPSVTLVNLYPIIFNHYFQGNFEMKEDKSYFSHAGSRYDFTDVTELVEYEE